MLVLTHGALLLDALGTEQVALTRAATQYFARSRNLEAFCDGFLSLLHFFVD